MAIRDKFRLTRKSVSSTSTSHTDHSSESSEPGKSPLRLAKSLTWRSNKKSKKKSKPDPRERPFTETNLKHQEMLSGFTMTFGRRRTSLLESRPSFAGGVSPGSSRPGSIDIRQATEPEAYQRLEPLGTEMSKIETARE